MENFIEFIKAYGWQLTLIAVAGIIILGILKYCKVFDKLEEKTRHFLYLLISVGLSIVGAVIYLACVHQLDASFVFTFATAVFAVNQAAYTIYDTTPLRDLLSKLWEKLVEFATNHKNDKPEEEEGEEETEPTPEPEPEPEPVEPEVVTVPVPVAVTGLIYNGEEQVAVASTDTYTVEGGSATDAGEYEATVTLVETKGVKYEWETEFDGKIKYIIDKAHYDLSGNNFSDVTISYDGKAHSILIEGELPEGIVVSYDNNNKIDVGVYSIVASFTGEDANHYKIEDMTATLTIKKASPVVIPVVDTSRTVYVESDFPELTLGEGSTEGTIAWEDGQTLTVGKNEYKWKFTPADTANYIAIMDSTVVEVVEAEEINISNTISFEDNAPTELKVHLPALGKATFAVNGTDSYTINITSNYGVTENSVIEFMYKVDGGSYLPFVDEYVSDFEIDKQTSYFVINCTPDQYSYKKLLERKWGSKNITFSGKMFKEYTYKMTITSADKKVVTVYLEQD